ncbi:polyprenyl synthetase family protein [Paracoccaceae bacterium]|nr:polyprenyl synthetase family protein [Paracoccaceae bacterium]
MNKPYSEFDETYFKTMLENNALYFNQHLKKFLKTKNFGILKKPIEYSILGQGKRLRPLLCMETSKVFNISNEVAIFCAIAIECIHTYSLVHDDLPSMDDDDLRRGQLTIHKKWSEATAILVGDALQSLGFEALSGHKFKVTDKVKNKLILSLAKNSGASGMVLGQALDIDAETSQKELKINEISKIQEYKTGKLISWSCEVGPIIAEENTEPFSLYAAKIGLAFQIIDDILDVTSSSKKLGKNVGKDMDKNKATFVSKLGLDDSKKKALQLVSEACEAISGFKDRSRNLCQIANFIVSRQF